jgi:hypothetical protein
LSFEKIIIGYQTIIQQEKMKRYQFTEAGYGLDGIHLFWQAAKIAVDY